MENWNRVPRFSSAGVEPRHGCLIADTAGKACIGTVQSRRLLALALVVCSVVGPGCSRPPQIGQENRRLIGSLRTAIAARKTDWLEQNAGLVDQRHAEGSLADDQYTALKEIIDQARSGNWAEAETAATRLSKVQQPTGDGASVGSAGGVNLHRHGK
jgi:hypothetical protein